MLTFLKISELAHTDIWKRIEELGPDYIIEMLSYHGIHGKMIRLDRSEVILICDKENPDPRK